VGASIGIHFIPLPTLKLTIDEGIEALRGIFHRIWIDENQCKRLIRCLENYRKEFDAKRGSYKLRPVHDWSSHGSDAARYLAIAIKRGVDSARSGPSDAEVDMMMNKYQPRFQ
jgi:hypothetical protein